MDVSGKTIVVTGGTGFIGSFFVEALLDRGATVRIPMRSQNFRALSERRSEIEWVEGDLRDSDYCTDLLRGADLVFHLAACRRSPEQHRKKPADIAISNVRMTLALLDAQRELGGIPSVFFSTANMPQGVDVLAIAQQEVVDGYIMGKAMCESLWQVASKQQDFPLLIMRPIGIYGPRDTFKEDANIIPALFTQSRDAAEALTLHASPDQERAFLYVEDVVDATLRLLEHDVWGTQYLTSGEVVSLEDLAGMIRDLVNPELQIRIEQGKQAAFDRTVPPDVHPILRKSAWTPLQDGIRKTHEAWSQSFC